VQVSQSEVHTTQQVVIVLVIEPAFIVEADVQLTELVTGQCSADFVKIHVVS
jgi:hypothetical protein